MEILYYETGLEIESYVVHQTERTSSHHFEGFCVDGRLGS